MKTDNLDHLIQQFYAAETNESQEEDLKSYALSDGSDAAQELKILFDFFESEKNIETDLNISLPQLQEEEAKVKSLSWRRPLIAVAASVIVLFGLFAILNKDVDNPDQNLGLSTSQYSKTSMEYNVESAEEALQIVVNSLGLVSESINTGIGISQQGVKETEIFQLINL